MWIPCRDVQTPWCDPAHCLVLAALMEWPASLALGLQRRLTEPNVSDPLLLLAQFRERHQLLSWPFLDVYFPQQPGLLLALVLAGLLLALLSVLALVLLLARFFGACEHRFYNVSVSLMPRSNRQAPGDTWLRYPLMLTFEIHCCSAHSAGFQSEAPPKSRFSSLLALVSLDWLFLCLCTVLLGHFILALGNNQMALASEDAVVLRADNVSVLSECSDSATTASEVVGGQVREHQPEGHHDSEPAPEAAESVRGDGRAEQGELVLGR